MSCAQAAAQGAPSVSKQQAMANMRMVKGMTPEQLQQQLFVPGQVPTSAQLQQATAQLQVSCCPSRFHLPPFVSHYLSAHTASVFVAQRG